MSKSNQVTNWLVLNESKKTRSHTASKKQKKKIENDELTKSPVSGTYIIKNWNFKTSFTRNEVELNQVAGKFVDKTPQARAKLMKIINKIGPYECKLCKVVYEDALELAMHNCPRVVHIEYKCSECDKVFNCPANLASHKRWHRPSTFSSISIQVKDDTPAQSVFNETVTSSPYLHQYFLQKYSNIMSSNFSNAIMNSSQSNLCFTPPPDSEFLSRLYSYSNYFSFQNLIGQNLITNNLFNQ